MSKHFILSHIPPIHFAILAARIYNDDPSRDLPSGFTYKGCTERFSVRYGVYSFSKKGATINIFVIRGTANAVNKFDDIRFYWDSIKQRLGYECRDALSELEGRYGVCSCATGHSLGGKILEFLPDRLLCVSFNSFSEDHKSNKISFRVRGEFAGKVCHHPLSIDLVSLRLLYHLLPGFGTLAWEVHETIFRHKIDTVIAALLKNGPHGWDSWEYQLAERLHPHLQFARAIFKHSLRIANAFSENQVGLVGAFPSFHEAHYPDKGHVAGHYFLKREVHFFEDVSVRELGHLQTPEDLWRALNNYGDRRYGCGAVFPTGNEWGEGGNKVYGAVFIRREAVEWRDIPVRDLGDPQTPDDVMRAVTAYADRNVFYNGAAFPTFHRANYGNGEVAGVFFIRPEYVRHYDIPIDHLSRYPDSWFSHNQRLSVAARAGNQGLCDWLIRHTGANINNQEPVPYDPFNAYGQNAFLQEGRTPLQWAITNQFNVEFTAFLLSAGANPNIQNQAGYNALHQALVASGMHYVPGQPDQGPSMIRLLTRQGVDASVKTHAGESVRHIVTNAGSGASKKLVWDTEDFFCLIALNRNLHFAKAMLERGQIDVNLGIELRYEKGLESVPEYARNENRNAPMWIIACHRDPELLRLVMATGMVDLLHTTTTGWTVAHMSAHVGVNNDRLGEQYVRELAKSPKAKYIFWQAKTRNFGGLLAVQISKNPQFGPELGIQTHCEIIKLRPTG